MSVLYYLVSSEDPTWLLRLCSQCLSLPSGGDPDFSFLKEQWSKGGFFHIDT